MNLILDFRIWILELRNSVYFKLIERSDSTNPKSLRGVGPYDPYGFRLVERAYSSERPEAAIRNLKWNNPEP
jgi:hypothetical protein